MPKYKVTVAYTVCHLFTLEVEGENPEEAAWTAYHNRPLGEDGKVKFEIRDDFISVDATVEDENGNEEHIELIN